MFFFFAGEVKCSVLLEPMSLMSYRATETLLNVTNIRLRVIGAEKIPQWRTENAAGERTHILSGWFGKFGEQFYLSYQILSCISLFQSMTRTTASH